MHLQRSLALTICIYISTSCGAPGLAPNTPSERLELEALKKAGRWANPDLSVLGSLVNQFTVRGLAEEGHRYFLDLESTHADADHYPVILAASGLMQVQNNASVSLLGRKKFVRAGIKKLDDAVALDATLPRYFRGTVLVNIPASFDETQRGIDDLRAVLDDLDAMPLDVERGAWRELARGLDKIGAPGAANALQRSGHLGSDDEPTILGTLSVTAESGLRFSKERVKTLAEGIYLAQGFDMTDIAFIESDEGLICIDAGTRPENSAAAWRAVSALTSQTPSQLLITHAHWDHIGGASTFEGIPSTATLGFDHEVEIGRSGAAPLPWLFGEAPVDLSFEPDVRIESPTLLSATQRSLELIPVKGGESDDAMLIWVPDTRTLFVGDVFMPYFGAPFAEEGNPLAFFETVETILSLNPAQLVHGHAPLTRFFTIEVIADLKIALQAVADETMTSIRSRRAMSTVLQQNLMPPNLAENPQAVVPFLVMRENFIKRLFDLHSGYWAADGEGIETMSPHDWARALDTLGGGEDAYIRAAQTLLDAGDAAIPLQLIEVALVNFGQSEELLQLQRRCQFRLRGLNQQMNIFKVVHHSERMGTPLNPVAP